MAKRTSVDETQIEELVKDASGEKPAKVEPSDLDEDTDALADDPEMRLHPCGLPEYFMLPGSKGRIVRYCGQYEVTHKDRVKVEFTPKERELFKVYRVSIGSLAAPKDFFTAALRLWSHGHPIEKIKPADLNSMKVR